LFLVQNITPGIPSVGASAAAGDVDPLRALLEAGHDDERAEKLNLFRESFCALLETMNK
jgi:hypothetical protein